MIIYIAKTRKEEAKMFRLHSEYKPTGDQPQAIEYLSNGIKDLEKPLRWPISYKKYKSQP